MDFLLFFSAVHVRDFSLGPVLERFRELVPVPTETLIFHSIEDSHSKKI